jgi:hypothetical protein
MRQLKVFVAAVVFLIAVLSGVKNAQAAFPDLGQNVMWNVTISGFTLGFGNLQFLDTVSYGKVVAGYIMIKAKPMKNGPSEFHLGSFLLVGTWNIDSVGNISGFMSGGSEEVPLDISFTGKGKDGISISLTGTSTNGPMHFKGTPTSNFTTPDLTGSWTSQVNKNGVTSIELFDLTPAPDPCIIYIDVDPDPNVTDLVCDVSIPSINFYSLNGAGPGYVFIEDRILVSSGNQIGLVVQELLVNKDSGDIAEDGIVRTITGKVNAKKSPFKASMSGSDDNETIIHFAMTQ